MSTVLKRSRPVKLRPLRWRRVTRVVPGLAALEFLERSRDMADDPVTAAPRPAEVWAPGEGTGTP